MKILKMEIKIVFANLLANLKEKQKQNDVVSGSHAIYNSIQIEQVWPS